MLSEKLPWPRTGIPSRSRIGLWAPSAAITYRARTVRSGPPSLGRTTTVTPSPSCSAETASDACSIRAPRRSAARSRTGSSPICVTKSRADGLMSSTPSLMLRKYQSSSFPPRLSTDTIAPFWTNSRPAASSISLSQADRAVRLDRALVDQCGARVDRGAAVPLDDERGHTVMTEEDGRRQPDEAAADDQGRERRGSPCGLLDSHAESPRPGASRGGNTSPVLDGGRVRSVP